MKRSFSRKPVPAPVHCCRKKSTGRGLCRPGFSKVPAAEKLRSVRAAIPGLRRQFRRPVRIIDEVLFFLAGDAVNGFTLAEFYDLFQD